MQAKKETKWETATFGAGCFWHVQADFDMLGVKTTVGYMGGKTNNPTYEDYAHAGHIEVCRVAYDPKKVSYKRLLEVFWKSHDPTQGNGQGFDFGAQYRSVIFYHNAQQKKEAEASLKDSQKNFKKKITTTIEESSEFWPAEEYHQKYYKKHGIKGEVC